MKNMYVSSSLALAFVPGSEYLISGIHLNWWRQLSSDGGSPFVTGAGGLRLMEGRPFTIGGGGLRLMEGRPFRIGGGGLCLIWRAVHLE